MVMTRIEHSSGNRPAVLAGPVAGNSPPCPQALGRPSPLRQRLLGLTCSIRCPGCIVILTCDAMRELRDAGVAVVGGFH